MRSTTAVFSFNNWFIDQVSVYLRVSWFNDSDFIFFLNYSVIKKKNQNLVYTVLRTEFKAYKDVKPVKPIKAPSQYKPPGEETSLETSYSATFKGEQVKAHPTDNKLLERRRIRSLYSEPSKEPAKVRWRPRTNLQKLYLSISILTSCNCTHIKPKLTRLYARVCISWFEFLLTETHKCYLIIQNIQAVPNGMWSNSP